MPALKARGIEISKADLLIKYAYIVSPVGADSFNVFARNESMTNNTNIAKMSPTDHLP